MGARLNFYDNAVGGKFAKYINPAGTVVSESTLPRATQNLVKIRTSQINGCSYCTDMHTKNAAHEGETSVRLISSRRGGKHRSSPTLSAAATCGHMLGETMTTISQLRWWHRSR